MKIIMEIESDLPEPEVTEVVQAAINHEKHIAKYKVNRYSMICDEFEEKYDMNSNDFRKKFEVGEIVDEGDLFDWYAAKRGVDHWKKKLEVLSKITI